MWKWVVKYEALYVSPYYMKNDSTFHLFQISPTQTSKQTSYNSNSKEKENEWVCFPGGIKSGREWRNGGRRCGLWSSGEDVKVTHNDWQQCFKVRPSSPALVHLEPLEMWSFRPVPVPLNLRLWGWAVVGTNKLFRWFWCSLRSENHWIISLKRDALSFFV